MGPASASILAALLDASARGSVLLAAAAAVALLCRHSSAARRHVVWSSALGALLLMPLLARAIPDWRVTTVPALPAMPVSEVASVVAPAVPAVPAAPANDVTDAAVPAVVPSESDQERLAIASPADMPRRSVDTSVLLAALWLAGALASLLPLVVGLGRVRSLSRDARPVTGGAWGALARRYVGAMGLEGRVRILETRRAAMPMTWGFVRPVVLLPADAAHWPIERRRDVLVHELAHVRRRDCLTQLIAHIACAVHWFNPLAWLAARRLRIERELACDDYVLNAGARASEYATHLLDVARALRPAPATAFAALAMARPSQLEGRLLAVLDSRRNRHGVTRRFGVPLALAGLALMLPLAALAPEREALAAAPSPIGPELELAPLILAGVDASMADAPRGTTSRRARRAPARREPPPALLAALGMGSAAETGALWSTPPLKPLPVAAARPAAPAPAAIQAQQCWDKKRSGTRSSHISNDDDGSWTVRNKSGDCRLEMESDGKVTFTEDLTDIQSIAPGGSFELEERDGGMTRRVEVSSTASGMVRRWFVDGKEQPYDDDARRWLAATLMELHRQTGFAADARVRQILAKSGVAGVLAEIPNLGGDYVKRRYLSELLTQAQLDAAQTGEMLRVAGRELGSDYEQAELLVALAKKGMVTAANAPAYVEAVRSIGSDYESRRALSALLAANAVTTAVVPTLLDAASGIGSDYEQAELLIGVSRRFAVDAATRASFFRAVNTIGSDYERRRVLSTVLRQADLPADVVRDLILSAGTIGSDYERASFLVAVAKRPMDDPTWAAYLRGASGIGGDYERGRVLSTIIAQQLPTERVADVLDVAARTGSGYELAEFLIKVARAYPIDEKLRPAFMKAAEQIESEHDYGRVMAALRKRTASL